MKSPPIFSARAVYVILLLVVAAHAITVKVAINFDGTVSTLYRAGEKPQGGSCPSGWTCEAIGTAATCDVAEIDADTWDVTASSSNEDTGFCAVYKTQATSADLHLEFLHPSAFTGHQGENTGCGTFLKEGTAIADYQAHTFWPETNGIPFFKTDATGPGKVAQFGRTDQSLSQSLGIEYDSSVTPDITGAESNDAVTWTEIGTEVEKTLTFPVIYGFLCVSDHATNTTTFRLDNIITNNTLEFVGGAPPPPPPTSETADYVDPVAGVTLIGGRSTVNVSTSGALTTAINGASCGDDITLASGTYTGNNTISTVCASNNPVIIKGAASFASVLTGDLELNGSFNIVRGIKFDGGDIPIHGTNNKILANQITNFSSNVIRPRSLDAGKPFGTQAEIAYNEIFSPADWGTCNSTTQFRMGIRHNTGGNGKGNTVHKDVWVHHNYFHDFPEKCNPSVFSSGQSDAVEAGESIYDWTHTLLSGWYFETNLVENHLQANQAVFDLKLGGVVMRNNTLKGGSGVRIDNRYAHTNIIESTWIENGGMISMGGSHKIVCNNIVSGLGIRLMAGTLAFDDGTSGEGQNASKNTLVAGNTGTLKVGHQYNSSNSFAADLTTIEDHTGSISFGLHTNTTNTPSAANSYSCTDATELQSSQVGPSALSSATTAYLDARGGS